MGGIVNLVLGDVVLDGTRWEIGPSSFRNPDRVISTSSIQEVESCLRAAEAAARTGSWVVGYVGYDAAPGFDHQMATPGQSGLPLVWFGVFHDRTSPETSRAVPPVGPWSATMSAEGHAASVESIRRSIEAGRTYQVNLTFAMEASLHGDAYDLFNGMVRSQRRSYGAFLDLGESQILSVSPELFLHGHNRRLTARPMKGTAPRGRSASDDIERRDHLVRSEKERAGNIMIVDLLRNDLGRIAVTGSVEAVALFSAERYPTVWQLTSTVECDLREDVGLFDVFSASFPSGSVTGAPKLSTMGIISDVETVARGVYCGAIGYIAPGGSSFEFSVAIRTGVVHQGVVRYHVGGGITYDSIAGAEYEECLWKALAVTADHQTPALLETMLYEPERGIVLLEGHMKRLSESALYWDIDFDAGAVGDALSGVGGHQAQKVRLILTPEGKVEIEVSNLEPIQEPVELSLAHHRIDASESRWFHKTLNRDHYPSRGYGETLMMNLDGEITETDISNVMARFGDQWVTPPVEAGCLPGVFRQSVLDRGDAIERSLTLDELLEADEIAVTNAVRGWRKAVIVE